MRGLRTIKEKVLAAVALGRESELGRAERLVADAEHDVERARTAEAEARLLMQSALAAAREEAEPEAEALASEATVEHRKAVEATKIADELLIGARRRLEGARGRAALAERTEWVETLGVHASDAARQIEAVEAAADALGDAMSKLMDTLVANGVALRRAHGVADMTSLPAFHTGLHRAVLARVSARSEGRFPPSGASELWKHAQAPSLTESWSKASGEVLAAAMAYTGTLQPNPAADVAAGASPATDAA